MKLYNPKDLAWAILSFTFIVCQLVTWQPDVLGLVLFYMLIWVFLKSFTDAFTPNTTKK